jgi:hypothetical protein
MCENPGSELLAQRGNLFHGVPPRPQLYIEVI